MYRRLSVLILALLLIALLPTGCKGDKSDDTENESEESNDNVNETPTDNENGDNADNGENEDPTGDPETENTGSDNPTTDPEPGFEGFREGRFHSERFNISFELPAGFELVSTPENDSLMFGGPDDLQVIIANTQSISLVDGNFEALNDRVSFEAVNILPDASGTNPVAGILGYRVEGDALLRGENVAIYFISQALDVPGNPVMATVFVPGDYYFDHSDKMRALLDSIEAINLRPF